MPSHSGYAPANSVADAAAKAYLADEEVEGVTKIVADWVDARPHLNERWVGGTWELADRRPYAEHGRRARAHTRREVGAQLGAGAVTAGRKGHTWADVARRALERTPSVDNKGEPRKATWEDVAAHNRTVGIAMQMKGQATEVLGLRHERTWARRAEAEGPTGGEAARSGEWGCLACRWEAIRRAKAGGVPAAEAGGFAFANAKHTLTGVCAAAVPAERAELDEGVATLQRNVTRERQRKGRRRTEPQLEAEAEWQRLLAGARRCTQRSRRGAGDHTITAEDFRCLQQLLAAAVPEWEVDDANKNDSSMTAARVDGALRGMRHAAAAQVDAMVEAERAGTRWCEERERGRGLMGTVLRAWREAVEHESSAESRPGAGDELNRTPRRWRERRLTAIEAAAVGPTPGGTTRPGAGTLPRRTRHGEHAVVPRLAMPEIDGEGTGPDEERRDYFGALACKLRQLDTRRRQQAIGVRARGRWAKASAWALAQVRQHRAVRRGRWAEVRRSVTAWTWLWRLQAAMTERAGREQGVRGGRGWRTGRKLAGYSESRTYTRRAQQQEESGSDTQPKARRTVWRKANGAEVGQVMLRRIEGSLPMTGAPTRRMRGGGVDRAAGDGRGNEGIT